MVNLEIVTEYKSSESDAVYYAGICHLLSILFTTLYTESAYIYKPNQISLSKSALPINSSTTAHSRANTRTQENEVKS